MPVDGPEVVPARSTGVGVDVHDTLWGFSDEVALPGLLPVFVDGRRIRVVAHEVALRDLVGHDSTSFGFSVVMSDPIRTTL